jgi:glycosyltransferase involved in cell wall biosynthesis
MSESHLRILFVITSLRRGGAERLCLNIANQLVTRKNAVVKFAIRENIVEYEIPNEIEVVFVPGTIKISPLRRHVFETDKYIKLVEDFQPHIIHSNLHPAEFLTYSLISDHLFYLTHFHSPVPEMIRPSFSDFFRLRKRTLTNMYERMFLIGKYRKARTEFIACSEGVCTYVKKNIPLKTTIHVLNNAIDLGAFSTPVRNMNSEKLMLLNVATLSKVKNQFMLLKIAAELKKFQINFELNILGDGENREALNQEIINSGLENYVYLRGTVSDVQKYYKISHLYLHTSISEGLPMVFVEAMASGLPVITTNCMSQNEIVQDGMNGFILDQHDVEGFVEKIRMISMQPKLYQQMCFCARETSLDYDIHKYIEKLWLIYQNKIRSD